VLFRFSLYGFLKNQRYFEPFLILALLDKGMSFFEIGVLIAFREVTTNILEIPSGSIADLLGRRRAMVVSFAAYVISFIGFWLADDPALLWPAMAMFSVGEAFRTGTHKAMIFAWLAREGRTDEKTKVYGHTRSWSKLGSAASIVVGAGLMFWLDEYAAVFLLSAIPAAANVINLATYPSYLDGERHEGAGMRTIFRHSVAAIATAIKTPRLRRLLGESMTFEGLFHASKDFLQPLLAACAITWFAPWGGAGEWSELQRTTLLIAPTYLTLHLLSAVASRRAHWFVAIAGGEARSARLLWALATALFLAMLAGELTTTFAISIAAFVLLAVAQNIWRPIFLSRLDAATDGSSAVTLSVESQARRATTMLLAPAFGAAIDMTQSTESAQIGDYWPIAAIGGALTLLMLARSYRVIEQTE
jgi:MFS family permease